MNWLSQISWPNSIAGALLGVLLAPVGKLIYHALKPEANRHLLKTWYSYNITVENGSACVTSYRWNFRKHLLSGKYSARGESLTDSAVKYSADVFITSDFIDLFLQGAKHDERALLMFRRRYPYQNREERLAGAFLGLDYDKSPFAGLSLLSREEMPDDDVRAMLAGRVALFKLGATPGFGMAYIND